MGEKGCASWDRAQGHMGRSEECFGTVQVSCRCTGVAVGKGVFLAGNLVEELVPELRIFDKLGFNVRLFDKKTAS
nr:hypothetical protein [Tanacetum cinerariifolium]